MNAELRNDVFGHTNSIEKRAGHAPSQLEQKQGQKILKQRISASTKGTNLQI
ncbi:hypothetical protein [Bacillus tequilensis]|uniref:hypothetical protein n=1 Tax=Bacillus tequilensis TaxID=227866 RepID=UPI0004B5E1F0|nr:hypothetical protein [Bacillus tequilensis]